jgi:ubiquinone/menaquinone biosynthesis C-methylase UbiE
VFFAEVLHDFQDQELVLRNAHRVLRHGGRVIDLDWSKESKRGPPRHVKFSEDEAIEMLERAGFRIEGVERPDEHHYMVRGRRE